MCFPRSRFLAFCFALAVFSPLALAQVAGERTAVPRTWTDASGQHKVRATLVKVEDGHVHLKRADSGAEIVFALEKLSKADQTWLTKHAASPTAEGTASDAPASAAAAGDWPCWLGPNHDGKSTDTGLLKRWPSGGPKLLWKKTDIGQGFSGVAVAGGTVYITGEKNDRLVLMAFDLAGKPRWQAEDGPSWTANYPGSRSTPTVDGDRVYLFSGHGVLGCFDTRSGKRQWSCEAKQFGGSPGGWGYAESPLIVGNLLIFKPGGGNCVVALDKSDGHKVWASRGFSAGPEYSSCVPIVRAGSVSIVTGSNEGLFCINAKTGGLLWSNPFAAHNVANCPTPAYADGYVFWANGYGKGGVCVKLGRAGKASEAWTTHDMVCHHGGYIIDKGCIYGNNEGGWACLDLKSGRKLWGDRGVGKGSLCWADGMLYLFSEHNGQAALATCSPQGLEIKGRVKVAGGGPSWAHPVVAGGRLYLRYDTNLYCFDVRGE